MSTNKFGPAFPMQIDGVPPIETQGMTLRDYFAAKALVLLVDDGVYPDPQDVSKRAYDIADAMLWQRDAK